MKKICSKCKVEKQECDFYANERMTDGRYSNCIQCTRADQKKYRKENKEARAKYKKKYHKLNREALCAKAKEYRKENKEKLSEYNKKYYKEIRKATQSR